jgi:hypothetical protein
MKQQFPMDLPLGYDEQTLIFLTKDNEIMLRHPVMPTMIYDETVMRYVEIAPEVVDARKTN